MAGLARSKNAMEEKKRVCVTGAGGYLASWLVKSLLSNGYLVHGTVRDPGDAKNAHLKKLEKASENLQLYPADLLEYNALVAAIAGCEGVFHVASPVPVPSTKVVNPEAELIAPAVKGTLNVLKASSEAEVKRVVVVSSISAVNVNPNWPLDKVKNENCWSDTEYCKMTQDWYSLSKTVAESEALDYAAKHELDVVTVCPSLIIGPLLQSTLNASSLFLISLLRGDREQMENRTWHFVDVRDAVDALLLVYEKPEASGRYICAPHPLRTNELADMLKSMYPNYNYTKNFIEENERGVLTSEKLKMLGWKCRPLKESLADAIEYYKKVGLWDRD